MESTPALPHPSARFPDILIFFCGHDNAAPAGLGVVFAGLALLATVFGAYMLFTLWDGATNGDRENREQAASHLFQSWHSRSYV